MSRLTIRFAILMLFPWLSVSTTWAQFGGSRAGVDSHSGSVESLPMLSRDVVEGFIAIDGRAEVRVRPTEIRIVLAVTSEGETAVACQESINEIMGKLNASWSKLGIADDDIVEDFIAVLPMYEWQLEKRDASEIGVEKKTGFRMQTNVHLAVPNDANAAKAFTTALEQGVTNIIAFDYWSKELDAFKLEARKLAVKAARSKSDVLLTAVFDTTPQVINVQEQTTVHYPDSLYHSFVNSHDEAMRPGWRRDIPFIHAHRPRNTYYRGLFSNGDVQATELPMHPEISVVSNVRLYFESPAAERSNGVRGEDED